MDWLGDGSWTYGVEGVDDIVNRTCVPSADESSRVKPVISVHGLERWMRRRWWSMMRVCHAWYVESCAVSTTWYGLRPAGQPSSEGAPFIIERRLFRTR